jgi:hypothetical protein
MLQLSYLTITVNEVKYSALMAVTPLDPNQCASGLQCSTTTEYIIMYGCAYKKLSLVVSKST